MSRGKRIWSSRAALMLALAMPLGAHALGLGEARVDSYLNQPLEVRMRLLDVTEADLDTLTVSPASHADFERLGLMTDALSLDLEVEVDRTRSPPVIRVSSSEPVTDPVVQLLIDARWANGRMLREYTLFLDPPTVAVAPPVQTSGSQPARRQPAAEPAREPAPEPRPRAADTEVGTESATQAGVESAARARAAARPGRYGPVAGGETLWSIAQAHLPAGDITMDQMMIAIVELNPGAFRNGNVNYLLRGAELELPDAERARAVDAAAAAAAVAAQNRAFNRRVTSEVPVVSDAARSAGSESGRDNGSAPDRRETGSERTADHRLALVPPDDEEGGSGVDADADEAEVEALRRQLARTEEELLAARQEAREFEARLSELESMVRENREGLGVRSAELAGLERTLRDAREAARAGADPDLRREVAQRLDRYLAELGEETGATGAGAAGETADAGSDTPAGPDDSGAAADDEAAADTGSPDGVDAEPAGADGAEAGPAPESEPPVTRVGNETGLIARIVGRPMLLVGVVVLLLALILAGLWTALRRRRREVEAPAVRPAPRPEPRREREQPDPVSRARARVQADPTDLGAHVGLLQTLASPGREDEFGTALEAMFEHVETGSEPEWREALELAGTVVPGHGLVKGSADWVASEPAGPEADVGSELEQEAEVDDLMSRLDADMDEADDSEWLEAEEEGDESEPEGPLLREVEPRRNLEDTMPIDHSADEEPVDLGALSESSGESGQPDESGHGGASASGDEDMVIDWPDEDAPLGETEPEESGPVAGDQSTSGDSAADETAEPASAESGDAEEEAGEDDIFSPGDDDADVKLDLARAYLSWNSNDSARTLLEEVVREGNEQQQSEARKLLDQLGDDTD